MKRWWRFAIPSGGMDPDEAVRELERLRDRVNKLQPRADRAAAGMARIERRNHFRELFEHVFGG